MKATHPHRCPPRNSQQASTCCTSPRTPPITPPSSPSPAINSETSPRPPERGVAKRSGAKMCNSSSVERGDIIGAIPRRGSTWLAAGWRRKEPTRNHHSSPPQQQLSCCTFTTVCYTKNPAPVSAPIPHRLFRAYRSAFGILPGSHAEGRSGRDSF